MAGKNILFVLIFSVLILSSVVLAQQPKDAAVPVPAHSPSYTDPITGDRFNHGPDRRDNDMGFRLAMTP